MSTAPPATADVLLPEPDGVVQAMWNVVRHGPNYDGRQKDVIAAAKAYAERHAAAVSAAKDAEIERLRGGLRELKTRELFNRSTIERLQAECDQLRTALGARK